jgi:UDP-3-O-[3-hydroxymyristoyl] glucosamine N-acyltransferase
MQVSFTLDQILEIVSPVRTAGATTETVRGIASLTSAAPGDLTFLGNGKYRPQVPASRASVILLPPDYTGEPAPNQVHVFVDNPSVALARLCSRIESALWPKPAPGIHASAVVAPGARIAPTATVGPLCVVEEGASIGERTHLQAGVFVGRGSAVGADCWLMPHATVYADCTLGNRVRLHAGVIVGSDGFGYETVKGRHEKVPQVGTVTLGDDVEVGAGTTIDRARFGVTSIGEGTKVDNLVQIGHNVIIGRHCIVCAQVGIAGSVTIGDYVVIAGQVGLAGHLTVGSGAMIAAKTGVKDDIPPKTSVWGSPSNPLLLEQKLVILRNRLPELFKRVDALERSLGQAKP